MKNASGPVTTLLENNATHNPATPLEEEARRSLGDERADPIVSRVGVGSLER